MTMSPGSFHGRTNASDAFNLGSSPGPGASFVCDACHDTGLVLRTISDERLADFYVTGPYCLVTCTACMGITAMPARRVLVTENT